MRVIKFVLDCSYWMGHKAAELSEADFIAETNISRGNLALRIKELTKAGVLEHWGENVYTIHPLPQRWAIEATPKDPEAVRALYIAIARMPRKTFFPESPGLKEALTIALEQTANLPRHNEAAQADRVIRSGATDGVINQRGENDTHRDSGESTKEDKDAKDGGGTRNLTTLAPPPTSQETTPADLDAMGVKLVLNRMREINEAARAGAIVPDSGTNRTQEQRPIVPDSGTTAHQQAPEQPPKMYLPQVQNRPPNPRNVPDPGTKPPPYTRATRNKNPLFLDLKNQQGTRNQEHVAKRPTANEEFALKDGETWRLRRADPDLVEQMREITNTARDPEHRWEKCGGNWTNYIKKWPRDVAAMIGVYREAVALGNHKHNPGGWMFRTGRIFGKFQEPNQ